MTLTKLHIIQWSFKLLCCLWLGGCTARVIEAPSASTQTLIDRGAAFLEVGAYGAAEASFQMALELQPTPEGYDGMACTYIYMGRIREAEDLFKAIREWFPSYLPAVKHLAFLHDLTGHNALAARGYRLAIRQDPLDFQARNNLAALEAEKAGNFLNPYTIRYLVDARALTPHPVIDNNLKAVRETQ